MAQDVEVNQAVIARLHQELVRAMALAGKGGKNGRVTIAEIYQELVPYRAVREAIGVELSADYEHALLRLLAGEGDRVRLEPASARQEMQRELKSSNPNVGIYRKFAACDVHVSLAVPAPVPEGPLDDQGTVPAQEPEKSEDGGGPTTEEPLEAAAGPAPAESAEALPAPGASQSRRVSCNFCRKELPAGRPARFCPFCGEDQRRQPCPNCSEVMEADWRYCIACGSESPVA